MSRENDNAQNRLRKSCVSRGEGPTTGIESGEGWKKIRASFLKAGDLVLMRSPLAEDSISCLVIDKRPNEKLPGYFFLDIWILRERDQEKVTLTVHSTFTLTEKGVRIRRGAC